MSNTFAEDIRGLIKNEEGKITSNSLNVLPNLVFEINNKNNLPFLYIPETGYSCLVISELKDETVRNIFEVFNKELSGNIISSFKKLNQNNKQDKIEFQSISENCEEYFEISLTLSKEKKALGIIRNITSQKLVLESLKNELVRVKEVNNQLNESLSDLEFKNVTLKKNKKLIKDGCEFRREFIAEVYNELRIPVNSIIGLTNLLMDTPLNREQIDFINMLKTTENTAVSVLEKMSDFIQADNPQPEASAVTFNLKEIIEEAVEQFAPLAYENGVEIFSFTDPEIHENLPGRPEQLRQILVNLLSNSVKFTNSGEIQCLAKLIDRSSNTVQFSIKDTGIGISDEKQAILFTNTGIGISDKKRADLSESSVNDIADSQQEWLGTTISKKLVELNGGNIWLESKFGEGSTFHFTISFNHNRTRIYSGKNIADENRLKKALIIDQHPERKQLFKLIFSTFGIKAEKANSIKEAIPLMVQANSPYDLLIIDDAAASIDNYNSIKKLHTVYRDKFIDSICLINPLNMELLLSYHDLGFRDWFKKPIRQTVIEKRIGELILQAESESENKTEYAQCRFPLHGKKVLIVEDIDTNRIVAEKFLHNAGAISKSVKSGADAIDEYFINQSSYDLILMDVKMPGINGIKASNLIREREKGKRTPIIAMTAYASEYFKEKTVSKNIDAVITKPLCRDQLIKEASILLEKQDVRKKVNEADIIEDTEQKFSNLNIKELDQMLDDLGGDTKVFKEICKIFNEDSFRLMKKINLAATDGDIEVIKNALNQLKGAAANFGATRLINNITQIEYNDISNAKIAEESLINLQHSLRVHNNQLENFSKVK